MKVRLKLVCVREDGDNCSKETFLLEGEEMPDLGETLRFFKRALQGIDFSYVEDLAILSNSGNLHTAQESVAYWKKELLGKERYKLNAAYALADLAHQLSNGALSEEERGELLYKINQAVYEYNVPPSFLSFTLDEVEEAIADAYSLDDADVSKGVSELIAKAKERLRCKKR